MTTKEYVEIDKKNPFYSKPYDGIENDKNAMIEFNKELINKYPWLIPRNRWTDKVDDDYNYSWTELDAMPEGWRIAFGDKMCQEIQEDLEKFNWVDDFRILQIKEKFGQLRCYIGAYPSDSNIYNIISKYEKLSEKICIKCGAPAKWETTGWISPWCDKCKNILQESGMQDKFIDIEKFFKN